MTTELTRMTAPKSNHQLAGVIASLHNLGLKMPGKHATAIEVAQNLRSRIAAHAPTPDEVLAAMERALKDGTNPLDTDESKRYATAQILLDPEIAGLTNQRAADAVNDAVAHAVPAVIESVRPIVEDAGQHLAHAFDVLGNGWPDAPSGQYSGTALAAWANGTEALVTLRKVAGLWGSIINLTTIHVHPTQKWLVFAEPDAQHMAHGPDRLDALWPVRKGQPVEMASLEQLAERRDKAGELREAAERRQRAADTDARSNHMNRIR